MFVDSELVLDLKKALGQCETPEMFRRLSDAVRLAGVHSKSNDWNVGQMDICVVDGAVTLPADVQTVLAISVDGYPTLLRDQWFQFHANGPGIMKWQSWDFADELGRVCTWKEPSAPVKLIAVVENPLDNNNVELRVYGWDVNGKRIYTTGPAGVLEDGFLVPCMYGVQGFNPEAPAIARIDRIQKTRSNGFIKLLAVNPSDNSSHTQIGYYLPWETSPAYRRIRVPHNTWIRIKYKRKDLDVRGIGDWINFDNREAILLFAKAVKFRLENQLENAKAYEAEGVRLISAEALSQTPNAVSPPQIIWDGTTTRYGPDDGDRLFY